MYLRVVGQNAVIVNFPDPGAEGHGADAAGRVRRTDRAAGARSRGHRASIRSRSRCSCCRSRATSTATAATGIRRPRSRDYATARLRRSPSRRIRRRGERHAGGPPVAAPVRCAGRAAAEDVRLHLRPAAPLSRRASSAASTSSRPRSCCCRRATTGARPPSTAPRARAGRDAEPTDASLSLVVQANPRQTSRGRGTAERAARDLPVLRLDHRRRAVSELHRRALRERPARAATARRISRSSTSRCRRRRTCGGTIR